MTVAIIANLTSKNEFKSNAANEVGKNLGSSIKVLPFKNGVFYLNGSRIQVNIGDNIQRISTKINDVSALTGVKSEVAKSTSGGYRLILKSALPKVAIKDSGRVLTELYNQGLIGTTDKHLMQFTCSRSKEVLISYSLGTKQTNTGLKLPANNNNEVNLERKKPQPPRDNAAKIVPEVTKEIFTEEYYNSPEIQRIRKSNIKSTLEKELEIRCHKVVKDSVEGIITNLNLYKTTKDTKDRIVSIITSSLMAGGLNKASLAQDELNALSEISDNISKNSKKLILEITNKIDENREKSFVRTFFGKDTKLIILDENLRKISTFMKNYKL